MRNEGINLQAELNGLAVNYTDLGPDNAQVLLFVHGFPFSTSMWQAQMDAFQQDYRVIAYDVRGHGKSEAGQEPYSIELFANDLLAFMDVLKIDKVTLCGLSMGGYIALSTISAAPNRFDALILCDTTCNADTHEAREKRMQTIQELQENGVEPYAEASLNKLFAADSFVNKPSVVASVRQTIINTPIATLSKTLQALADRSATCDMLFSIKIPVLILVGQEDALTPPAAAEKMRAGIPGSTLQIIPHAGHLSNLENSSVFNAHLGSFLKGVYPRTT